MPSIYEELIFLGDRLEQNQTAAAKLTIIAKRSEVTYNTHKSTQKSKELDRKYKFKKGEECNERASDKT